MKETLNRFNQGLPIHNTIGFLKWVNLYEALSTNSDEETLLIEFTDICARIYGKQNILNVNLFEFLEILKIQYSEYKSMTEYELIKSLEMAY